MGMEPKKARGLQKPGKYGAFGTTVTPDEKYLFGTEAEIDNRVATGYVGNPASNAPKFEQIRPGPTGKSANDPQFVKNYGTTDSNYDGNPRRYA